MKKSLTEIKDLRKYLVELLKTGRPGDSYPRIQHAPNIDQETVFAVVGNLVMTADDYSIRVGTRTTMAGHVHELNQIWFTVKGHPYWLGTSDRRIEIRARNRGTGGAVTTRIINKKTAPNQVAAIFASL